MAPQVVESKPERKTDPQKRKHRAKKLFRDLVKGAVKESVLSKERASLSESQVRHILREGERRAKIAKSRKAIPGTKRWEAVVRSDRLRPKRRPRRKKP